MPGAYREMRSRVALWLAGVAVLTWWGFIFLFEHYDATRPTCADRTPDRIYVQNNHGHYVYLNSKEENYLTALQASAAVLFVGAMAIEYFAERRHNRKQKFPG
jgi:hypothetical protein